MNFVNDQQIYIIIFSIILQFLFDLFNVVQLSKVGPVSPTWKSRVASH